MKQIIVPSKVKTVAKIIATKGKYKGNITYVAGSASSCPLAREFGHNLGSGLRSHNEAHAKSLGLDRALIYAFILWVDNTHKGVFVTLKKLIAGYK